MKTVKSFYLLLLEIITASILCGCNNEPFDYSKLYINRMDLSGAKSLVLIKDDATRAIEGEFLSAGLYKMDENGNLTAVAVFFTEDKDGGNHKESTHTLTIKPKEIYDISKSYMIAEKCTYYDQDGDEVSSVSSGSYSHLLIRKTDGRIWKANHGGGGYREIENSCYRETDKGDLYRRYHGVIYKYNLDSNSPTLDQITKYINFFGGSYNIQDNGVFWEARKHRGYYRNLILEYINIEWPYSGHTTLYNSDLSKLAYGSEQFAADQFGFEDITTITLRSDDHVFMGNYSFDQKPLIILNPEISGYNDGYQTSISEEENNKFQQFCHEFIRANFLEIGDTWGDIHFGDNPIILQQPPAEFVGTASNLSHSNPNVGYRIRDVYPTDDYVLVIDVSEKPWLTLIDLKKHEWRWLRQLETPLCFNNAEINSYPSVRFSNRIWFVDNTIEHFGCRWLDLNNFEDGFTPFDFTLPDDRKNSKGSYSVSYKFDNNGMLTSSWTSNVDGNTYFLKIDILSGHGELTMKEEEMKSYSIIPLN